MCGRSKRKMVGSGVNCISLKFYDEEDKTEYEIQAFSENSTLWFIAADVCDALGINNTSQFVSSLNPEQFKRRQIITETNGIRYMIVLKEGGFYRAVLRSRKAFAKPFQRWVAGEVLPSIRRTGTYVGGTVVLGQVTN